MWRGFGLGIVFAGIVAALVGAAMVPVILNHKEATPIELQMGRLSKQWSVPGEYKSRANPVAGDQAALAEGRRIYSISCVACHGASGSGNGAIGRNLFPPPTNLVSDEVKALTDGEMFYFIRNGISFVGMPSYGITTTTAVATYNEQQIWQLVAHVRNLQAAPPGQAAPAATPGASPSPQASPSPAR